MRIYFESTNYPKKAAKRVKKIIRSEVKSMPGFKLSTSQTLVARMMGYSSWHELHATTTSGLYHKSEFDEMCERDEQVSRLKYQSNILALGLGISMREGQILASKCRVSACNPNHPQLVGSCT